MFINNIKSIILFYSNLTSNRSKIYLKIKEKQKKSKKTNGEIKKIVFLGLEKYNI